MNNGKRNKFAVFFISTGRCGSQFFADKLAQHYSDLALSIHEPLHEDYQPRHYFSKYHHNSEIELNPVLQEHIRSIEETLMARDYIETGWPVYGLLPYLIKHFKGRIKIVHLYRHPINVAASLSTHNVYCRGDWTDRMSITPYDYGIIQKHLGGDIWSSMCEFSKCLFWWTEINNFALELKMKTIDTPWFSLKFENVFNSENEDDTLAKLTDFLELPKRKEFLNSINHRVDKFSHKTNQNFDIEQIFEFGASIQLMNKLGYTFNETSMKEISERYSNQSALRRILKKIL